MSASCVSSAGKRRSVGVLIACLFLLVAIVVNGECPNSCSGHGRCGSFDACTCYRNWMGNDCSERICQFGLAHVDTPKGDLDASSGQLTDPDTLVIINNDIYPHGTTEQFPSMYDSDQQVQTNSAHWYRECSNKGLCDRATGDCKCFEGYEGSACQRASCPISNGNVCSGHGICKDIKSLADDDSNNLYNLWDEYSTLGCKCDAGFTGPDCSQKQCKTGVDPLYVDGIANTRYSNWTVQFYTRNVNEYVYGNYSLTFYDAYGEDWQTGPIDINANCMAITEALEALPNDVIPMGSVRCQKSEEHLHNSYAIDGTTTDTWNGQTNSNPQMPGAEAIYDGQIFLVNKFILAFPGNPGKLDPLKVNIYLDGQRPTLFTKNSPSTLGWHIFPAGFTGETVDYVSDECFGVLTSIASDGVSPTHFLTGMDTFTVARLKACLGDSNGVDTDNINTYNWDYGNWMNPHLIKLVEATQDSVTQYVRPDGSVYKLTDIQASNDGSVVDSQLLDYPVSKLCTNGRAWVTKKSGNTFLKVSSSQFDPRTNTIEGTVGMSATNPLTGMAWDTSSGAFASGGGFYDIGQQGYCMNLNPPGFYAVIYFDDCSSQPTMNSRGYPSGSTQAQAFCSTLNPFRILNRAASDYSSNTKFHVFTTRGFLQQVNQNVGMYTTTNTYTPAQAASSYHTSTVRFANVTENYKTTSNFGATAITQDFVGQIDCETTELGQYGALDCVEKGDLVMFLSLGVKDPVAGVSSTTTQGASTQSVLAALYDSSSNNAQTAAGYNGLNLVPFTLQDSNVQGLTQTKCFSGVNANNVAYGPYNIGTSSNPIYTCPNSGAYQPTMNSLRANPVYPNLYTVKKIARNAKEYGVNGGVYDGEVMKEIFRHTATLDFALNGRFNLFPNYRLSQASDPNAGQVPPATTATIYKFYPDRNNATSTYVGPCSTRGICDTANGLCTCFNGYTGDACDSLNALAM